MRKAEFIEFKNKKDLQTKVNANMGYKDRFWYMIELISLSQTLASDKKKYIGKDQFITLKRIAK